MPLIVSPIKSSSTVTQATSPSSATDFENVRKWAQRGLPRRPLFVVYVAWAIAAFCLVGYAESDAVWEAALVSALSVGSLITGQILWESLLQRSVPGEYLGRVASVDSFVSSGLVPLSLAITGPIAGALGTLVTLRWAGVIAGGREPPAAARADPVR